MKKALKFIFSSTIFLIASAVSVLMIVFLFHLIPEQNTYANVDPSGVTDDENIIIQVPEENVPSATNGIETQPEASFEPLIDAYKIIIDGSVAGIVTDANAVDNIIHDMQEEYELNANVNNTICELSKTITVEKMQTYSHNITENSLIENAIAECVSFKMNAFELSIDGFIIGYFETEEECSDILKSAQDKFLKTNFAGKTVLGISYDKTFDVASVQIYKEELDTVTYNDAVDIILSERDVEKKVSVASEAELANVFSSKAVSDSCDYNEILTAVNESGSAFVYYNERIVNFNVTVQSVKTSPIAYNTEYRANTSLSYTTSKVVRNGTTGTKTYTYSDEYVNGECVSSKLTSEKITTQPVSAIIEYGTRLPLRTTVKALTGKGMFIWPSTGFITSHFAYVQGKGGHTGIDIANVSGTPIYASAAGTVKTAISGDSIYGNYVTITHSNGYETQYAHMLRYVVKPGQYVRQGQIIGYVGMTGIATGNHLHFSIRLNGKLIDPTTMLYGYAS